MDLHLHTTRRRVVFGIVVIGLVLGAIAIVLVQTGGGHGITPIP